MAGLLDSLPSTILAMANARDQRAFQAEQAQLERDALMERQAGLLQGQFLNNQSRDEAAMARTQLLAQNNLDVIGKQGDIAQANTRLGALINSTAGAPEMLNANAALPGVDQNAFWTQAKGTLREYAAARGMDGLVNELATATPDRVRQINNSLTKDRAGLSKVALRRTAPEQRSLAAQNAEYARGQGASNSQAINQLSQMSGARTEEELVAFANENPALVAEVLTPLLQGSAVNNFLKQRGTTAEEANPVLAVSPDGQNITPMVRSKYRYQINPNNPERPIEATSSTGPGTTDMAPLSVGGLRADDPNVTPYQITPGELVSTLFRGAASEDAGATLVGGFTQMEEQLSPLQAQYLLGGGDTNRDLLASGRARDFALQAALPQIRQEGLTSSTSQKLAEIAALSNPSIATNEANRDILTSDTEMQNAAIRNRTEPAINSIAADVAVDEAAMAAGARETQKKADSIAKGFASQNFALNKFISANEDSFFNAIFGGKIAQDNFRSFDANYTQPKLAELRSQGFDVDVKEARKQVLIEVLQEEIMARPEPWEEHFGKPVESWSQNDYRKAAAIGVNIFGQQNPDGIAIGSFGRKNSVDTISVDDLKRAQRQAVSDGLGPFK